MEDDDATKDLISSTVLDILKNADMDTITEGIVRKQAAKTLQIDLSIPHRRQLVRSVVESFLTSATEGDEDNGGAGAGEGEVDARDGGVRSEQQEEVEEEAEVEEEVEEKGGKEKEYDDDGDLIICHLNKRRRVTLQDFRGKTLVSIREFYEKDGRLMPSSKGISLTVEQWKAFKKAVPAIESAIQKMEGSD